MKPTLLCWTITPDVPALKKQTAGVAQALNLSYEEKIVSRRKPWRWLPHQCYWGALQQLTQESTPLTPPWPDIAIGSGRKMVPFLLALQKASQGKTKIVFVQNPGIKHSHFDAIIAPEHDQLKGKNIISTFGATHNLSQQMLHEAAAELNAFFSQYPPPFLSIFIGGSSKKYVFTAKHAAMLAHTIIEIAERYPGTLFISSSRRTGLENTAYLKRRFQNHANIYFYDGTGKNPYNAMLAVSDFIFTTDDSISMISEACFTGKPVYLLPLPEQVQRKKISRFINAAIDRGLIRYYQGALESWDKPILDETSRIAPQLSTML